MDLDPRSEINTDQTGTGSVSETLLKVLVLLSVQYGTIKSFLTLFLTSPTNTVHFHVYFSQKIPMMLYEHYKEIKFRPEFFTLRLVF